MSIVWLNGVLEITRAGLDKWIWRSSYPWGLWLYVSVVSRAQCTHRQGSSGHITHDQCGWGILPSLRLCQYLMLGSPQAMTVLYRCIPSSLLQHSSTVFLRIPTRYWSILINLGMVMVMANQQTNSKSLCFFFFYVISMTDVFPVSKMLLINGDS